MRLRLITYNIHKGIGGMDRCYRPERIVETLAGYEPDVVLLQEVDDGVPRSQRDRQVDLLGDALGLRHRAFQPNVELRIGAYGNGILSRFPLADVEHVDLTVPLKKRRRALLAHCRVPVNGHTRRLLISNLHLGLAGFERKIQLRRLLASGMVAYARHDTPAIAAGDFNDVYGNLGRRLLEPAGFEPAGRYVRTFPAALPLRALDRIYFRGDLRLVRCFASQAGVARQASDHLPIIAEFEVLPRAGSCIPVVCQHPDCRRPPVDPLDRLPAAG
jgi:endonuclease/exonuclease/phosphatase family metal-dependent hydrolase